MLHDTLRKHCAMSRKIAFWDIFQAGTVCDRYFSANSEILLLFRKGFVNYNVKFR